jgi:hypothetical protein
VPVVFLIAIIAVLVGIFFTATGRGGEMADEHADHAPLDLGPVSAADVALLRPPTALWGYNMQVTDAALDQIARAVRERDVTIAYLQEQVAGFERNGSYAGYSEPRSVHARQAAGLAPVPGILGLPEAPAEPGTLEASQSADTLDDLPIAETAEAAPPPGLLDEFLRADTPEAPGPAETPQHAEAPPPAETPQHAETPEPAEAPQHAEAPPPAEAAETPPPPAATQAPPRTPLILRASLAKAPPATEPHEVTQPSEIYDPTQPSATLAPDEPQGPQGDFNAHDWWAEQREAARQENPPPPAGTGGGQEDDPAARAEEQSW